MNIKQKAYSLIRTDKTTLISSIFDGAIITIIIINVVLVILDTFNLPVWLSNLSSKIEIFSIIFFSMEYALRVWMSDYLYPDKRPFVARLKYIFSFMAMIDLISILPFYLPFVIKIDLRILRTLRMIRLLRLFKMNRYTNALHAIGNVFKKKKNQLLSSIFIVFLLMIIASVLMYSVENPAQPDKFQNAFSGLWWAIATFTTVGYGDIYPITVAGKFISAIIALLGIGLVAVPTGIISAGFIEQTDDDKENENIDDEKKYCPYCGHKIGK